MKTYSPDEVISQQNEQIARLTELVKVLTATTKETKHISTQDVQGLNYDLRALAEGRAVIDNCFPERPKPAEPKEGEISRFDPNLANHLEEVASGKLKVV